MAAVNPTVYSDKINTMLSNALSRLDLEITSPSMGSFDRTWWCWKFTDFSAPRLQEGIYTLAWLYTSLNFSSDAYHNPKILARVDAAINFWIKLQHNDGSFDEAYPYERSLAATAFTGFYVGCAIELLRPVLPVDTTHKALLALERLARWLLHNGEYHGILSNHLAAAAGALQVIGDLLDTKYFISGRDRYLQLIYQEQHSQEGWLREYGGADPGYQSHAMFYLAEIWKRTKDKKLFNCLKAAVDFIAWFIHPDGTIGGEYASRGTKFAYPAGFEILAEVIPMAASITKYLRSSLINNTGVGLLQMDIWNLFPLLNNYIFALENFANLEGAMPLPWQQENIIKNFSSAGLTICHSNKRLLVVGNHTGGSLKLWETTGKLLYEDCGYALFNNKTVIVSQNRATYKVNSLLEAFRIRLQAPFVTIPNKRMTPWYFVAFRLFMLTLGRNARIARWVKGLLVASLIKNRKNQAAILERIISFNNKGVLTIIDKITQANTKPLPLERHIPIHMGSTRYAHFEDWLGSTIPCPQVIAAANCYYRKVLVK